MKYLKKLIENISSASVLPEDSIQLRINKKLISIISFFITISGLLWGVMYIALEFYLAAISPILYSVIVGFSLLLFRKHKNFDRFVKTQLLMILILPFSLQWSLGGFENSGAVMVWAILGPFGSLIFQENRDAIFCFLLYLLFLLISILQNLYFPFESIAESIKILFFGLNISFVSIFSFFTMLYFVNVSKKEHEREALLNQQREIIDSQKKITESYARFVPMEFLSFLSKDSIEETMLGDFIDDELTVLFSDIRGFTTLSESMESRELMKFLNSYLSEVSPIIKSNFGIIDKFIGDAIMAIFPQSPLNALYASIELIQKIRSLNESLEQFKINKLHIGIGMHTGKMTVGTIGSDTRMDTTVVGDAVNLASRIEALTKVFHVPILISEQFYKLLDEEDTQYIREIDITSVKGKSQPVKIFEVFGADPPNIIQKKLETKNTLMEAIHLFREGKWNEAKNLFTACQKKCPEDPIPVIYINRCENLKNENKAKIIQSIEDLKQKQKTVLIVDDNSAMLEVLQFKIRKNKYYAITANNGLDAIQKYEQFSPEVVLTDLYMPDMNGFDAAKKILEIANRRKEPVKIIFITSEDSDEIKEEILKNGYSFLPKPINYTELFNQLS